VDLAPALAGLARFACAVGALGTPRGPSAGVSVNRSGARSVPEVMRTTLILLALAILPLLLVACGGGSGGRY
jgi:hypothetical protein